FASFKIFGVIIGQICCSYGCTPFVATTVGFHFTIDDLEETGQCNGVTADESDLIPFLNIKFYFTEDRFSFNGLTEVLYFQNFITYFPLLFKNDTRIFTVTWSYIFKHQFIQCLLTRSGLFTFGSIGSETCNEFQ